MSHVLLHVHFCPLRAISLKNRPCRQKGFKTRLQFLLWSYAVSDRGWVLKGLSICSAAYCYKHLKKLLFLERKDKLLLRKLGGFQGCWCASRGSRARTDNHNRRIHKCLRTTYATSARLTHQVLLPGAHNLGMHSVCHSYQLLASTRTRSHSAYSDVQSQEPAPAHRNLSFTKNMLCQCKSSPQLGTGRMYLRYHMHRAGQKNCFAYNCPKTAGSLSQILKRRHTQKPGVRLQERHRFRLQKTGCREEFIPAASVTLHTDVLSLQR